MDIVKKMMKLNEACRPAAEVQLLDNMTGYYF